MTAPLKVWQHGYDLAYLAEIQERFCAFNQYSRSPFSEMNKPQIAQRLRDKTMVIFPWGIVDSKTVKYPAVITCYQDLAIAHKQPGDRIVSGFCYDEDSDRTLLIAHLALIDEPCYLWIWQESADERDIAEKAGFTFIACKVSSFAELRGLWFRDGDGTGLFARRQPELDPTEYVGIAQANVKLSTADLIEAVVEVTGIATEYTDHYSAYNDRHSWSALSLRGYADSGMSYAAPSFIEKPSEMNNKWWEKHSQDGVRDTFTLQDTPLRAALPVVDSLCKPLTDLAPAHRIRLMKLAPGGGELRRHTDLVDKDSGIADGKVARFHIPIVTNDQVSFGSWDLHARHTEVTMKVGECWYLDTRKPHTAVNRGPVDRIHLVVDVEANARIRGLLDA